MDILVIPGHMNRSFILVSVFFIPRWPEVGSECHDCTILNLSSIHNTQVFSFFPDNSLLIL